MDKKTQIQNNQETPSSIGLILNHSIFFECEFVFTYPVHVTCFIDHKRRYKNTKTTYTTRMKFGDITE